MADSRLTIHECDFKSRPCDNYTCRQAANKKKFFVGNPGGSSHKPIFCEDCIGYLVANLPADMVGEAGSNLEAKLRAEITVEYEAILEKKVFEAVQAYQARANEEADEQAKLEAAAAEKLADPNYMKVEATVEKDAAPEEDDENAVYRCLDCGQEFDTPQKLGSHRRKHKDG